MDDESALKNRIEQLSDDELLQMITEDAAEYREEAIGLARVELRTRGIDTATSPAEIMKEAAPSDASEPRGLVCVGCGGKMRSGKLFAERELSVIFDDNREERFVSVLACGQCGQLSLNVDYVEEVQH